MSDETVIIAGGGIGGLTLALTLHQIGVPCLIVEASATMLPLGVGINIQPNAVRELLDLGIELSELDAIGVSSEEWALVGLNGKEVYAEPRGIKAGYKWPQYAVHRGQLLMLLYNKVVERLGEEAILLGHRVTQYRKDVAGGVTVTLQSAEGSSEHRDQNQHTERRCQLLIGADGIHSKVRAQMHPNQPPIHWGGVLMWRGTARVKPMRTQSSFIGLGTHQHRVVIYPISSPDENGDSLVNWIAEVTVDNTDGWQQDGWFRKVEIDHFIHHFEHFQYDWLDVPAMIRSADCAYENPMIDRDPVSTWVDGPVALMGDAAHAMYPTGSNGASQAIVDARVIGAKLLQHGLTVDALKTYDDELCSKVSAVVLRNRGAGPFGLLNLLNDRCGGVFDDIEAVLPVEERREFMARYKQAAGFAMEQLNEAPPTIPAACRIMSARSRSLPFSPGS